MKDKNKQIDLENIRQELDRIGASYEIDQFGNILATMPQTATIASVPFKDKKNRRSNLEVRKNYYFQNGSVVMFPARNNYLVAGIAGYSIALSHFAQK